MLLYGKNPVVERLNANPKSIKKIYLNENNSLTALFDLAKQKGIPCRVLKDREFSIFARQEHTQGIIAEVAEFYYADFDELLALPNDKKYTLIALSNITDPQNLGSILRTAACFGGFALIIPKHRTVRITETVLKIACGGENYVPIAEVTNLIPALEKAKKSDYWIAGTVVEGGADLTDFKFFFPLCIVIGSEEKGIRPGITAHLDFKLTLPMPGENLSLNAAVATAVFCYEIMRQKRSSRK